MILERRFLRSFLLFFISTTFTHTHDIFRDIHEVFPTSLVLSSVWLCQQISHVTSTLLWYWVTLPSKLVFAVNRKLINEHVKLISALGFLLNIDHKIIVNYLEVKARVTSNRAIV